MKRGSIRLRLAAGGAIAIVVALMIAGAGMTWLFERHVARRLTEDLEADLRQLAGGLELEGAGGALAHPPLDPRFDEVLSGRYWQIAVPGPDGKPALLRSRSLWDERLTLPEDDPEPGAVHHHVVHGPNRHRVITVERLIHLGPDATVPARLVVAADFRDVRRAARAFAGDLFPALGLLAVVLAAAGFAQISLGLRPLERLRDQVSAIRSGGRTRLDSAVPEEVGPLVVEMNALLDTRDDEIARARHRAADLAHGLKTPLAALAGDAERLRERGETEIAGEIEAVGAAMRRHVERELARARARGAARDRRSLAGVAPLVTSLVETLRRTPDGQRVDFAVDVPPDLATGIDRDDLAEVLGNLAENAARHARGAVRISARRSPEPCLVIEDDGPGVPAAERAVIVERGKRLDEAGPGTGLGLTIVADVLETYGLKLRLADSPLGGLLAEVPLTPAG